MYDLKQIQKVYQEFCSELSLLIEQKDNVNDPIFIFLSELKVRFENLQKDYAYKLIDGIKEQRQKEIKEGKHACTRNPLYVVYDVITSFSEDTSRDVSTSLFDYNDKYIDAKNYYEHLEEEKPSDIPSNEIMGKEGYHDRFITVCFTREAAEQFIKDEKHNLEKPRIYVHYAGRRNYQLQDILELLGDD